MPDIDGYEFCRWVRNHPRLKLVPLIFLTAKSSTADKIAGFRMGGDDYITKPYETSELLARIKGLISRVESLRELSIRDELTGAFNRRYFNQRLEEELWRVKRTGHPFSMVFLDIDFFKLINDQYGHYTGDFVLVKLVSFLQGRLRKTDLVARLGGEEFVILLPNTVSASAYLLVETIRENLAETTFHYDGSSPPVDIQITVSAGVVCCPEHGEATDQLLTRVDKALYDAKACGRNTVKIAH